MKFNIKKSLIVLWIIFFIFILHSCEKIEEKNRQNNRHVDMTIGGKEYRNSKGILFPMGSPYPIAAYRLWNDVKFFSFTTDCIPRWIDIPTGDDKLLLKFWIFLDEKLQIGKKYYIQSLKDFNYYLDYDSENFFKKKKISYCHLSIINAEIGYCYGNGFIEITSLDLENMNIEGLFEFEIPFTKEIQENPEFIKVKGKFKTDLQN